MFVATDANTARDILVVSDLEKELIRKSGTLVRYPRDQIIWSPDEVADRVYLIESGYVKIYKISAEGQEVTVGAIRNPGEMIGLAETLYHGNRTCYAGAIRDIQLVVLTKDQFLELMNVEPSLAVRTSKLLAARMRAAESMVFELVCWQAAARLALFLLKVSDSCGIPTDSGTKIKLALTHHELASMIGASRQTVTVLLNTFRQEKSIIVDGREIVITDHKKLAAWVNE
ncbi:MAG: Crp/Fnr family transcriptional regulator [Clostridia bacterium]|nr:Crp/Fnr family transcriptional regulator [Clostridia bacterium]